MISWKKRPPQNCLEISPPQSGCVEILLEIFFFFSLFTDTFMMSGSISSLISLQLDLSWLLLILLLSCQCSGCRCYLSHRGTITLAPQCYSATQYFLLTSCSVKVFFLWFIRPSQSVFLPSTFCCRCSSGSISCRWPLTRHLTKWRRFAIFKFSLAFSSSEGRTFTGCILWHISLLN